MLGPPDMSRLTGGPPDPDSVRRTQLFEDSCARGYGHGCYELGEDHHGSPEGDAWYQKSIALYEPACAANDAEQCSLLGYNYLEARGVARDPAKAVSLFTKACDLGDGYGCDILGQLLVEGRGVAKDLGQARARFQQACEIDPPYSGCFRLGGMILDHGRGDTTQALVWFHRGCPASGVLYDCGACNALGDLCRRGINDACGSQTTRCQ
jgi:TPR repeat protein